MIQTIFLVMAQGGGASFFPFLSMILIFAVLYFLILRPQQKQAKKREAMLKTVEKGHRILTSSGIFGTVLSTKPNDVLVVKIADNVRVEMTRQAVSSILDKAESEGKS